MDGSTISIEKFSAPYNLMKVWKEKVKMPKWDICRVKELDDNDKGEMHENVPMRKK